MAKLPQQFIALWYFRFYYFAGSADPSKAAKLQDELRVVIPEQLFASTCFSGRYSFLRYSVDFAKMRFVSLTAIFVKIC